jgi:hypothetical protein
VETEAERDEAAAAVASACGQLHPGGPADAASARVQLQPGDPADASKQLNLAVARPREGELIPSRHRERAWAAPRLHPG